MSSSTQSSALAAWVKQFSRFTLTVKEDGVGSLRLSNDAGAEMTVPVSTTAEPGFRWESSPKAAVRFRAAAESLRDDSTCSLSVDTDETDSGLLTLTESWTTKAKGRAAEGKDKAETVHSRPFLVDVGVLASAE